MTNTARYARISGTNLSVALTVAAWVSLGLWALGAPWSPFLPGWILLGSTAVVVGIASAFIERTVTAVVAAAAGAPAPIAVWWFLTTTPAS